MQKSIWYWVLFVRYVVAFSFQQCSREIRAFLCCTAKFIVASNIQKQLVVIKQASHDIRSEWQAAMTASCDTQLGFERHPCVLELFLNMCDKARSFCQPSSPQIILYKKPLTPRFFWVYSQEFLKSLLCPVTGVSSESWLRTLLLLQCCPVTPTMATITTLITRASWWCPPPPWVWPQPRCQPVMTWSRMKTRCSETGEELFVRSIKDWLNNTENTLSYENRSSRFSFCKF